MTTHKLTSKDGRSTFRMHNSGRWTTDYDGVIVAKGPLVPDGKGGWKLIDPVLPASLPPPPDPAFRWGAPVLVLRRGSVGAPDRYFAGISPCQVRETSPGILTMWYVGADSLRPGDREPANRVLLTVISTNGGRTWTDKTVVKRWQEGFNPEAGVFGSTDTLFSAITAATPTTTEVTSDGRRLSDDALIIDHRVGWGGKDEKFPIAILDDKRMLYVAKGAKVQWGLGLQMPDGNTRGLINPGSDPSKQIRGGSYLRP